MPQEDVLLSFIAWLKKSAWIQSKDGMWLNIHSYSNVKINDEALLLMYAESLTQQTT